jgi:hypothetical protein
MHLSLVADGLPVVEFPMRTNWVTRCTAGLRQDGNPVPAWCLGNVVRHYGGVVRLAGPVGRGAAGVQ